MIYQDSTVRLGVEFRDPFADNALVDPTEVRVAWLSPSGVYTELVYETDEEIERDDTGIYHVDVLCDEGGVWQVRWWGTGAVATAAEQSFFVVPRAVVEPEPEPEPE